MKFGIGQPVRRKEDERLLRGAGRFLDDIPMADQAHAAFLRSPHAHAAIRSIDTARAAALPGVLAVATAADIAAEGFGPLRCHYLKLLDHTGRAAVDFVPAQPLLAEDRVRHVGDAVAMAVAETPDAARAALDLVDVVYDPLPPAVDLAAAARGEAPPVWDEVPDNICFEWENGDRDATERAFRDAAHTVTVALRNNRVIGHSLEPRGAIGCHDPAQGSYTLYASTQGPYVVREYIAQDVLGLAADRLRVVTPDVGGGFGLKLHAYNEYGLVLWAAKRIGRSVKWTSERSEAAASDKHGRDNITTASLALDGSGRILALKAETLANMGAYLSNVAPIVPTYASRGIQLGAYVIRAAHVAVKGVYTHTVPVDAYRGAGRPEAVYLIERLVDAAAGRLGMDPAEMRRRNLVPPAAIPYDNPLGLLYDSGEFETVMDLARDRAAWEGAEARRAAARARGRLHGIGMAYYVEKCGDPAIGDETAALDVDPAGVLAVRIGTQASGQGHETAYAQLVEEMLGVPFASVELRQGDTVPGVMGGGSGGSRSLMVGGSAIKLAVDALLAKGKVAAAEILEAALADIEFADGAFRVAGTDRHIGLFELAGRLREGGEGGLAAEATFMPEASSIPNGCHICEVEIDPETGAGALVSYVVVDDFGRVVNPLLAEGQVHGGVAQGIGQALFEEAVYDPGGQLLSGSFMDYGMPRASDVPNIRTGFHEVPTPNNPLGVKGAGESGAIAAPPAVMNAIADALGDHGRSTIDMPATPEKIWRAIAAR